MPPAAPMRGHSSAARQHDYDYTEDAHAMPLRRPAVSPRQQPDAGRQRTRTPHAGAAPPTESQMRARRTMLQLAAYMTFSAHGRRFRRAFSHQQSATATLQCAVLQFLTARLMIISQLRSAHAAFTITTTGRRQEIISLSCVRPAHLAAQRR